MGLVMGLFDFLKKRTSPASDEAQVDDGMLELLALLRVNTSIRTSIRENGLDVDVLPNGQGEFGLEKTNPVPTNTPSGSDAYLKQLRTLDGKPIKFSRIGSFGVELFPGQLIDGYDISSESGEKLPTLWLNMYQRRNSNKAPKGFYLAK